MSASYTGFTAQANSSTGVEFSKLYDPLHLLRVTQDMMFDKYADARFIPANSGVKQCLHSVTVTYVQLLLH